MTDIWAINKVAVATVAKKEVRRYFRIWVQTLLPSAITMVLYFVIFGELIGPRVGKIQGYSYMAYIAPGLIMMAIINNSFTNVVSSFYSSKFQRSIEEMFVAPMASWAILLGYTIGGVSRACLVGGLVTIIALFFTKLHLQHVGVTLLVLLLTSMLFSVCGLINAIFSRKFDDISIVSTFVLTPLTYLGGVFYYIEMLPSFWQKVTLLNPIFYIISAFRYGMLGVSSVSITKCLVFIVLLNIILFVTAWQLLVRGISLKS